DDPFGYSADPLRGLQRGASIFLNDQSHRVGRLSSRVPKFCFIVPVPRVVRVVECTGPDPAERPPFTMVDEVHSNLLAVLFALASALTIAWGTVVRHRIAEEAPAYGSLKGSPFWHAISRPLWWACTGTALLGYGLQVVA